MEKEIRNTNKEIRLADQGNVEGYAVVVNTEYTVNTANGGSFIEEIKPEALQGVIEANDVYALINHDDNKKLARSKYGKGSLKLSVDETGLRYGFKLDDSPTHRELNGYLTRGDMDESSFAMLVTGDDWEKRADGTVKRTISKMNIYDVSPVFDGCNPATSVSKRSQEKFDEVSKPLLEIDTEREQREKLEAQEAKEKEFENYYKKIKNTYLSK